MVKFLKHIIMAIVSLAIGLFIAFWAALALSGEPIFGQAGSGPYSELTALGKITAIFIAALGFGLLYWLFAKAGLRADERKPQYFVIASLVALSIFGIIVGYLQYTSNRRHDLIYVTGDVAQKYFSENQHKYYVISEDSDTYRLESRSYHNAYSQVLESDYRTNPAQTAVRILEYKSAGAGTKGCDTQGTYPCKQFDSNLGKLDCYDLGTETSCNAYLGDGYVTQIKSSVLLPEELIAVANELSAKPTQDIQLTE